MLIKNKQVTQSNGSGPGVLGHFCHGHFGHGRFDPDISATDISAVENAEGGHFGHNHKGVLAIRRIFSLVDMITKPKFSNCPNIFKIGLFR